MGTQTTTNYGWIYPNPFEEDDAWGSLLNALFVEIDADLKAVSDSRQPLDGDLTAIAALAGTSGFLKKTAANTWSLDTATYQPINADLTAIGALAGTSGFLKKTAANTWSLDTSSYSLVGHVHAISDVTGLQTSLDGKQPIDADLTAIGALAGTSGFLKKTAANTWALDTSSYSLVGHTHAIADVTGLQAALDGKQPIDADLTAIGALVGTSGFLKKTAANTWSLDTANYSLVGHTHVISDVTGLQAALDGKQPLDAELTAIAALTPTADNFIAGDGATWVIKTPAAARLSLGLGTLATLSTVGAAEITDGSVGVAELASNAVTTVKIADANVTTAKIADANVTTAKIADVNVTTAKIADASITPAKLNGAQSGSAPIYAARAWVNFNGSGTPGVLAGGNVSSITDNGIGDYTVNMTTAMADTNYTVAAMASSGAGAFYLDCRGDTSTLTSSAFRLNVHLQNSGNPTKSDPSNVYAVVMR